jgi:hypothetical protein
MRKEKFIDAKVLVQLKEAFQSTFVEKAIAIMKTGVFADVDMEAMPGEEVVDEMNDFEKGLWTYMKSLVEKDPLKELRESPKNIDGCVVDIHCLMLVDHENECHFQKELEAISEDFEKNKLTILRDRELHKRTYGFMIGLIEDRLNLEIKKVAVRKGWKIVVMK